MATNLVLNRMQRKRLLFAPLSESSMDLHELTLLMSGFSYIVPKLQKYKFSVGINLVPGSDSQGQGQGHTKILSCRGRQGYRLLLAGNARRLTNRGN